MSLSLVAAAIRTRALADTGTGGLFNVGSPLVKSCTHEYAPATDSATNLADLLPYIVFTFPSWEEDQTFSSEMQRITCSFHVYTLRENGAVVGANIMDRIYGDAVTQANRTPTYGFHRHTLVLGSQVGLGNATWYPSAMRRTSRNTAHERDVYHYIESYHIDLTRAYTP